MSIDDWTCPAGTAALVVEGNKQDEQIVIPLERNLTLDQTVGMGALRLGGPAGRLLCRPDGYWLEPIPGRAALLRNGQPVNSTVRLDDGDVVSVGPVETRFRAA